MKSEKTRNSLIIVGLMVAIVIMSVGYAALAQQLTINGTAGTGDANWNTTLTTEGATELATPTASGTSATFNVELAYPGASITYDIEVQNKGTIDATLTSVDGVEAANSSEPSQIVYSIERVDASGNTITTIGDLLSTEKQFFRVTATWTSSETNNDTVPTADPKTATITLNYLQKTA